MSSLNISASGLAAQRARLDLIAENLANAETTRTLDGGPYQRQQAVLTADSEGGVKVSGIVPDTRPSQRIFEPGHPDADATGYVAMPNVNPVEEMVDLVTATRAYEANVTAFNAGKAMTQKALEIGRG
jgi:flagellar basal-body rod protein FlgC